MISALRIDDAFLEREYRCISGYRVPSLEDSSVPPKRNPSIIEDSSLHVLKYFFFFLAPNTRDLDVFLRKQESGFGFRVLGGDGPDQPVSETAHSYLIVLLLE